MNEMLAKFPPELKAAFGLDGMDLSTVLGFYSLVFLFVQLCLAIQAGNYGFGLVSIEESELTADFLLSKPVSRAQVLTSKLLAALSSLLAQQVGLNTVGHNISNANTAGYSRQRVEMKAFEPIFMPQLNREERPGQQRHRRRMVAHARQRAREVAEDDRHHVARGVGHHAPEEGVERRQNALVHLVPHVVKLDTR